MATAPRYTSECYDLPVLVVQVRLVDWGGGGRQPASGAGWGPTFQMATRTGMPKLRPHPPSVWYCPIFCRQVSPLPGAGTVESVTLGSQPNASSQ